MASPDDGGRGKKTVDTKEMKRCPHCGAKNKSSFEYCLRCSESLDDVPQWGGGAGKRSPMVMIVGVIIAATGVLVVLALVTSSATEEPQAAVSVPRPTPAMNIERPAEPILEEIDAQLATQSYSEAIAAFRQADYDKAISMFEDLALELPENARVLQYLGLSYFHNGDFAGSKQALAAARELRPDSFELLDHYVTACKKDGDDESAFAALKDFVDRRPGELDARLELARIARATGDEEVAMRQTEYLARTRDTDPEFAYEYGVSLKNAGQFDEAKAVLRSSIELDPSSAAAHHALGVTELISGNASGAVASLEQAVAAAPDNGDYHFSLAQTYEELDRIPESLASYEAYIQHARPDDTRASIVRKQLELAKKALAERERERTE